MYARSGTPSMRPEELGPLAEGLARVPSVYRASARQFGDHGVRCYVLVQQRLARAPGGTPRARTGCVNIAQHLVPVNRSKIDRIADRYLRTSVPVIFAERASVTVRSAHHGGGLAASRSRSERRLSRSPRRSPRRVAGRRSGTQRDSPELRLNHRFAANPWSQHDRHIVVALPKNGTASPS